MTGLCVGVVAWLLSGDPWLGIILGIVAYVLFDTDDPVR